MAYSRRFALVFVIAALQACIAGRGAAAGEEASVSTRVILESVDRYRVFEPLFEGVRVILSHRGEKHTPAYLQGISGAAFRIGGPCPCAPTCEYAMSADDLIRMLGYECEHRALFAEGKEPEELYPPVLARVKEEIRAGRPVLVWNAFTVAEFDVVCGFDEEKRELIGRGSYKGLDGYATAPETRPTEHDVAPAAGAIFIGKKVKEFDARAAEIAALKEAVAHARGSSAKLTALPTGLACYPCHRIHQDMTFCTVHNETGAAACQAAATAEEVAGYALQWIRGELLEAA